MTFFRPAVAAVMLAVIVSACAGGPGRGPRADGPPRDRDRQTVSIDRLNQAYLRGAELQAEGKCKAAIRRLYPVAMAGSGFEDAQRRLGECLIDGAAGDMTAYLEGLVWLRRAGEAGWPEAQGALAVEYVEGPLPDADEAAMWLALYEHNPKRSRVGFTPLPKAQLDALYTALSDETRRTGQIRADGFKVTVWQPPKGMTPGGPGDGPPGGGPGKGDKPRGEKPYDEASAN